MASRWNFLGLLPFLLTLTNGVPLPHHFGKGEDGGQGHDTPPQASSDIQLQLENLKGKNESHKDLPGTLPGKNETLLKSELNLEKPTVSDNSPPESIAWLDVGDQLDKRGSFHGQPTFQGLDMSSTPHDIAEYVFWTGNEHAVTLALSELLDNGLLAKEDAIVFLELINEELNELQRRYEHHRQSGGGGSDRKSTSEENFLSPAKINEKSSALTLSSPPSVKVPGKPLLTPLTEARTKSKSAPVSGPTEKEVEIWGDYDEMLAKMDELDKEREASLEKGIRQLAHDLFSKTDNENPQLAMQRLAIFVDKLAKL